MLLTTFCSLPNDISHLYACLKKVYLRKRLSQKTYPSIYLLRVLNRNYNSVDSGGDGGSILKVVFTGNLQLKTSHPSVKRSLE